MHAAFCIALALAVSVAAAHLAAAELIDRVMAVAGGEIILLSDVAAARDLGLVKPDASAGDPIAATLSALIDRELILVEVDRYAPPEPPADAVDAALATVRARFGSPAALASALQKAGIDESRLRARLRDDLRIREYEDQRFTGPSEDRRKALIAEWVNGLRRRADVSVLYLPSR